MHNTKRREPHPIVPEGHDLHAPLTPTDHRRGAKQPSITVIEYGDFESISCRAAEPAVQMLLAAHPRTVQLVFRHFPLEPDHPLALMAAEATEAAAAQGKFWEMHDALLLHDAPLDRAALDRTAQELGLDIAMFRAAMDQEIYRQRIREQEDGAVRSHLRGSPGFFVNGKVCDVSGGMQELADTVAALDGAHFALQGSAVTGVTARVEKVIHASAAEVWNAITTPGTLKKFFFGADVQTDWKVGSPIRMSGEFKGKKYEDKGEVLAVEPRQRLGFSHWSAMSGKADSPENYHIVTFNLSPSGAETKVVLTQANLTGGTTPSDVTHRADYEKNWSTVLGGLAKLFPWPAPPKP